MITDGSLGIDNLFRTLLPLTITSKSRTLAAGFMPIQNPIIAQGVHASNQLPFAEPVLSLAVRSRQQSPSERKSGGQALRGIRIDRARQKDSLRGADGLSARHALLHRYSISV